MPALAPAPDRIATPGEAQSFFSPRLAGLTHERLCIAFLDGDGRVLGELCLDGGPDEATLPLRRIFAGALRCDAQGLAVAHNHPGGSPQPSRGDLSATRRLARAADALGISLHDHLILLPDGKAVSLRARGLL